MTTTPFAIRFDIATPMVGLSTPFDATEEAIWTQNYFAGDYLKARAHSVIAKNKQGIAHVSSPIFEDLHPLEPISIVGSLKEGDLRSQDLIPNTNVKGFAPIRKAICDLTVAEQKQFKETGVNDFFYHTNATCYGDSEKGGTAIMNQYDSFLPKSVWFFGLTTNFDLLEEIASQVLALGKWHKRGFGKVTDFAIEAIGSTDGLVDAHGMPMRPIPVDRAKGVSKKAIIADCTFEPAYWDKSKATKCYVPPHLQCLTLNQIQENYL